MKIRFDETWIGDTVQFAGITLHKMSKNRASGFSKDGSFVEYLFDDGDLVEYRGKMPSLTAEDILGVQPMTAPTGQTFNLRHRYDDSPTDCSEPDQVCGGISTSLIHIPSANWLDSVLFVDTESTTVEQFFTRLTPDILHDGCRVLLPNLESLPGVWVVRNREGMGWTLEKVQEDHSEKIRS